LSEVKGWAGMAGVSGIERPSSVVAAAAAAATAEGRVVQGIHLLTVCDYTVRDHNVFKWMFHHS